MFALAAARDRQALYAWSTPRFFGEDRRSVVAGPRQTWNEFIDALLDGLDLFNAVTIDDVIAIRGDTLVLTRARWIAADGFDVSMLGLGEVDTDGRPLAVITFDADDLAAAIDELDMRYLAGEGAAYAEQLRIASAHSAALFARDWDAAAATMADDFVAVDHRGLWPELDKDGHLARAQSLYDQAPDTSVVSRSYQFAGPVVLATNDVRGTGDQGDAYTYTYHLVAVTNEAGQGTRFEYFDEHDFHAAVARLDELSRADSRIPRIENTATRSMEQFPVLARTRRFDAMTDLIAENYLRVDHRRGVPAPTAHGPDDFVEMIRATLEVGFDDIRNTPVAVRGERVALSRVDVHASDGREISFLQVHEWDNSKLVYAAHFDEDDLDAAMDELAARYAAGEGAAHANLIEVNRAWIRALNSHDHEAVRTLAAPDFEYIDHRPFGAPSLDLDSFIEWQEGYRDIDNVVVVVDMRFRDQVSLTTVLNRARDVDGGEILWPFYMVGVSDPDGRARVAEAFAAEDGDAALARFDELAAGAVDARHPSIENAATRIVPRATSLYEAGRRDDTAALFAESFRRIDRRTTVSFPEMGKNEYLEWHQSAYEQFDTITFQPLAVRGEHLCLLRVVMARDGFESVFGMLVQLDDEGLIAEYVSFDEADLAVAQDELDDRFIAGEGAPYASLLRAGKALAGAYVAKDTAAVARLRAPGFTFIDHRRFGWDGPDTLAAFDDLDESFLVTKYLVRSNAMLASVVNRGVDPRGNDAEWLLHIVTAVDGENRFSSTDWYDAEDWNAALARFDELAAPADPRHPRAENATTRLNDRFVTLIDAGRTAEAGMVADDFVRVDRRSTVAAPETSGSGEYADALAAALDVGFTSYEITPIAVRGERLALSRVVLTTNDGFDMRFLVFDESGDDGRALRSVYFDDDDLVTAFEALELRHRELSGDAYTDVERSYVDRFLAFNRGDMDSGFASLAADFQMVDHGPMGFGTTDGEGLRAQTAVFATQMDSLVQCPAKRYVSPSAVISVVPILGSTSGRNDIVWQYVIVECFDRDGLVAADHNFQIEQWDEALALFDEWTARAPTAELPGVRDNAAVRVLARHVEVVAARDWDRFAELLADDVVSDDRRSGVNSGVTTGREAIGDLTRGLVDVGFTTVANEVLAVRGDRLALTLRRWIRADGFELPTLALVEVDADERWILNVLFDADDLAGARDELDARYLAGDGAAPE
jgi:hypothetical protein